MLGQHVSIHRRLKFRPDPQPDQHDIEQSLVLVQGELGCFLQGTGQSKIYTIYFWWLVTKENKQTISSLFSRLGIFQALALELESFPARESKIAMTLLQYMTAAVLVTSKMVLRSSFPRYFPISQRSVPGTKCPTASTS